MSRLGRAALTFCQEHQLILFKHKIERVGKIKLFLSGRLNMKSSVSWDRITAIVSLFIAVLALVISIWEGMMSRQHNRLSVMPNLAFELNYDEKGTSGLYLYNRGLGPARIKSINTLLNGEPLPENQSIHYIASALKTEELGLVASETVTSAHYLYPDSIVDVDEVINLIGIPPGSLARDKVGGYRDFFYSYVQIVIEYCSLYDDCETVVFPHIR